MRKYVVLMDRNSAADKLDRNPDKINYEQVALMRKNSARVQQKEQEVVRQEQFAAYVGVGEPFVGLYRAGVKCIDYVTVDFVQSKDIDDLSKPETVQYSVKQSFKYCTVSGFDIDDLSKPETVQYLKDCLTEFGGI